MSRYNEILQKVKWNALQNYLNDGIAITDTKEVAAKLYAEECVKASLQKASDNIKVNKFEMWNNEWDKYVIIDVDIRRDSITNPENIILL